MAICAFSALIRETPGWWEALRDDTTLEQWRTSAPANSLELAAVEYAIAELERYARLRDDNTGVEVCIFVRVLSALPLTAHRSHASILFGSPMR